MKPRKAFCLFLTAFLTLIPFHAEEWVLAISAFDGDKSFSTIIPQLIMAEIPDGLVRLVTSGEMVENKKKTILEERRKLQNSMQEKIKARDAVLFSDKPALQKKSDILSYEREILTLQDQIFQNIEEYQLRDYEPEPVEASVTFWQKNREALFSLPSNGKVTGVDGLITGTITRYADFIHVRAELSLYPGGIKAGSFESAATTKEMNLLASEIAAGILDTIVNTTPVSIAINVQLEEGDSSPATVRVDGNKISSYLGTDTNRRTYQQGVHEISVSAPGYKDSTFFYDFSDDTSFNVTVKLEKAENIKLTLNIPDISGTISHSAINDGGSPAQVYVNGLPVMGEVRSGDGVSGFFFVDRPDVSQGSLSGREYNLDLAVRESNPNDIIEKSRRNMYTAFGLFLISLPFSFMANGKLESVMNASKNGSVTEDIREKIKIDRILSYVSIGASVALGVNWGIRLGGYIMAANSLLPEIIIPEE
ncbi:MAG: hypothetical protein K5930_00355 [Treponemataceae bacterium]|nr:hypothetical protein [Treponemataceae bacterium]